MNSIAESYPQSEDQELMFFRSLKTEMRLLPTRKIVGIVRVVLTSVAKSLPTTQVNEVVKKLPSTLQMVFTHSWKANDQYQPVVHLDELVETVCNTETKKGVLFTNEVEALKYVLIVIKNLKIVFDKIGVTVFPYSMISEYQQAVQEEAV